MQQARRGRAPLDGRPVCLRTARCRPGCVTDDPALDQRNDQRRDAALTLTVAQRASLSALCDLVLPAEGESPSAGACGIDGFLDEWLSAPYPRMRADRDLIAEGLRSLDWRATRRHGVPFAEVSPSHQALLFDALAREEGVGRSFAIRLVNLICGGYFTTAPGHDAIGYVGNRAQSEFPPPAPAVVEQLEAAVEELSRQWGSTPGHRRPD